MNEALLHIIQIPIAGILIIAILLQSQGSGLGSSFGGEGNFYRTKRGLEKKLFTATIILSILYFSVALTNVLL